jgi:hypothetical protein
MCTSLVLLGYQFYRESILGIRETDGEKWHDMMLQFLMDPGPSVVVADEGHIIKNRQVSFQR